MVVILVKSTNSTHQFIVLFDFVYQVEGFTDKISIFYFNMNNLL